MCHTELSNALLKTGRIDVTRHLWGGNEVILLASAPPPPPPLPHQSTPSRLVFISFCMFAFAVQASLTAKRWDLGYTWLRQRWPGPPRRAAGWLWDWNTDKHARKRTKPKCVICNTKATAASVVVTVPTFPQRAFHHATAQYDTPQRAGVTSNQQSAISKLLCPTNNKLTHSRSCRVWFSCRAWAMFFAPSMPMEFSLRLNTQKNAWMWEKRLEIIFQQLYS